MYFQLQLQYQHQTFTFRVPDEEIDSSTWYRHSVGQFWASRLRCFASSPFQIQNNQPLPSATYLSINCICHYEVFPVLITNSQSPSEIEYIRQRSRDGTSGTSRAARLPTSEAFHRTNKYISRRSHHPHNNESKPHLFLAAVQLTKF